MKRFILLTLGILGLMVISLACVSSTTGTSGSAESTPQPVVKHLSAFSPIEGTQYQIANISGNPDTGRSDFSPFRWLESGYTGYSGYGTYNYVFFDTLAETFQRVLPTNDAIISQIMGFPFSASTNPEDFKPVRWWLYLVYKADTNGDGALGYPDKLTIGISDVGGNGYTEMVNGVDAMLGQILKENDVLFVIYNTNGQNFAAKFDLPGRKVISTNEIPLGDDVK